jgi:hypothetical protein
MHKLITLVCLIALLTLAFTSVAVAHPSENRAEQSTFGGPHCHINVVSGKHAYPSHMAHIVTGLPEGIFKGAPCPE